MKACAPDFLSEKWDRRKCLTGIASVTITAFAAPSLSAKKEDWPNIVFILLDDQPWDAFSKAGRYPFLKTPNMAGWPLRGAWFSHFYCTAFLYSGTLPEKLEELKTEYNHNPDRDW